jgi:putative Holliday junction resolvase
MGRILCIDYGEKRTGIAVTDPLQIIATPLTTIPSNTLISCLKKYVAKEAVELILIGEPFNLDQTVTHATLLVHKAIQNLKKNFPGIPIQTVDEQYTSKMASKAMVYEMGMKKKQRQVKENVDQIAAAIMLQTYLQERSK